MGRVYFQENARNSILEIPPSGVSVLRLGIRVGYETEAIKQNINGRISFAFRMTTTACRKQSRNAVH